METEKLMEIKEKVSFNPDTCMSIKRIPRKAKVRFVEFANEEFEGDYGMALKFLIDFKDGVFGENNDDKINILADEIVEIKKKLEEPKVEKKIIKMSNGRIVEVGTNGVED